MLIIAPLMSIQVFLAASENGNFFRSSGAPCFGHLIDKTQQHDKPH
jgi:hypothetical protein